jgi:hypothetical protein
MLHAISDKLTGGRNVVQGLALTLMMVAGFSFVQGAGLGHAHAAGCRVIANPAQAGTYAYNTEATVGYTGHYYVPSTSACVDINVQNITFRGYRSAESYHCGTFWVRFYPSSGGSYTNSHKYVCSTGPSGPVVPIATNVANGTQYRVEYWTNGDAGHITPKPAYYYNLVD